MNWMGRLVALVQSLVELWHKYFVALLAFGINILPVQAEKNHQHNSKGQEQVFDNFFLQLYQDEILTAVKDYYNDDSIRIGYDGWDKNYDVVELL